MSITSPFYFHYIPFFRLFFYSRVFSSRIIPFISYIIVLIYFTLSHLVFLLIPASRFQSYHLSFGGAHVLYFSPLVWPCLYLPSPPGHAWRLTLSGHNSQPACPSLARLRPPVRLQVFCSGGRLELCGEEGQGFVCGYPLSQCTLCTGDKLSKAVMICFQLDTGDCHRDVTESCITFVWFNLLCYHDHNVWEQNLGETPPAIVFEYI